MVNMSYAGLLWWVGLSDEAMRFIQVAYELDPMAPVINSILSGFYEDLGDYDNAMKHARITNELGLGEGKIANVYEAMGDWENAVKFYRLAGMPDWFIICVQHAHAPGTYPPPIEVPEARRGAACLERLGEHDTAFRLVAESIRTAGTAEHAYFAFWKPGSKLVEHADFPALAEEIGLLAYWQVNGFPENCRPDGDNVRCTAR